MDLEKLQELIRILETSELNEIEIEENGLRMRLQKAPPAPPPITYVVPSAPPATAENALVETAAEEPAVDSDLSTIDSPMVGTFYVSPAPGETPFVEPGKKVESDQTVCIVEAMKLMNEVCAKFTCIIDRNLVEDGQPVEFGQPLFAVRLA